MNVMPKNIMIAVSAAALSVLIPLGLYRYLKLPEKLSQNEKILSSFNESPLQFSPRTWQETSFVSPLSKGALDSEADTASQSAGTVKAAPPSLAIPIPKTTFIIQNNGRNMAVIDGSVVSEGSTISGWRVKKIENSRILLQGKRGEQWINID